MLAGKPTGREAAGAHPNLTGPRAQRIERLVALRLGPAVAGGAITYAHTRSEWQAVLVFACMAIALTLLLRPRNPLHLMRVAPVAVYLAGPLLGALGALAISELTRSISPLDTGDLLAPVLGAWFVIAIGVWLVRGFDRDRRVRLAVIGTAEFMWSLSAEIATSGVNGYSVVGAITPTAAVGRDRLPTRAPTWARWARSASSFSPRESNCWCSGRSPRRRSRFPGSNFSLRAPPGRRSSSWPRRLVSTCPSP